MVEDAHLRLLYEEQEEARDRLREEQDRAFAAAMEKDRQRVEEEQEAEAVSLRQEELLTSLELTEKEMKLKEICPEKCEEFAAGSGNPVCGSDGNTYP